MGSLPHSHQSVGDMARVRAPGGTTGNANWHRLNEVFAGALESGDEAAQRDFVHRAANGDAELQAAALEMLRASRDASASDFLRGDALRAGAVAVAEADDASAHGQQIGDYRIIREIGRGGMGTVFLAERQQFRQRVALKVIKRGMDTDEIVRRFQREREVLADLNHPNIARLLDGGTTAEGLPYFVMDYVEGRPITEFCDENRLSIDERLHLFQKLCGAVRYIHRRSIIHRDIKPSNAVIDSEGEPKLLDFGIAKLLASSADGQTSFTATAAHPSLLTPEYASPEQLRGERLTATSDIYSLGVLLYELMSGHRPFGEGNTSRTELVKLVQEEEPAAPSTAACAMLEPGAPDATKQLPSPETVASYRGASAERLRRRLRGDLDNITLKALRKEPERRYATIAEFCEDIARHLAGKPVSPVGRR